MIALFSEIVMVETLARNRLTRALPRGMELSHFMVLNHFARLGGEKTPAQLARVFHVTKGAMTNTVARLEAAGYVHVRPDWEDGRRKLVSISHAGRGRPRPGGGGDRAGLRRRGGSARHRADAGDPADAEAAQGAARPGLMPTALTRGARSEVKSLENRRLGRLLGKPLKRLRFSGLESGWKVAGKWLATF